MIQRYWDPGIREEERLTGRFESEIRFGDGILQGRKAEDGNSRFSFDFGWVGLIEVTMKMEIWIWRKLRITRIGILILISIIIKTKLNQEENRCGDTKISRKVFQKESYSVLVREMWDCRMSLWLMGLLREIDSVIMNQREIKENCGSPRMRIWDQYKRKKGVIGVPWEFKTEPTFESIGDAIGRTVAVDLDHSRVQVVVDAFNELCFETTVDFTGGEFYDGEEAPVSLLYEKLFGYCQVCGSLCHKDEVCPLDVKNIKKSPEKKREGREGNGAWYDGGKYDDRARSYKGVVINGNANQQNKEREGREYYGKSKGKMGEETYSKWMKVSERGSKRAYTNRGTYRGDGEASRHRPARREDSRPGAKSGQIRPSSGQTREQQPQQDAREEVREEVEIRSAEESRAMPPSQAFQVELAKSQAEGTTVISDPIDVDQGLAAVHGMQEDHVDLEDEDVMDMDEIKAHLLENEIDMDAKDFLEKLEEEETKEVGKKQKEENNAQETDEVVFVEEEQGTLGGDAVKKPGLRKSLFKPSTGTAGSTKMRAFNALASPRKRAAERPGTRHGDTTNQAENGYRIRMWDDGLVGLERNQRHNSLVAGRRLVSLSDCRRRLVSLLGFQWWHMKLGVLGFIIFALGTTDCFIVLVCYLFGRVRSLLLIDVQCLERFWFIGYGVAGFSFKNSLRGLDYLIVSDTVRERVVSLVSSNQDQLLIGWRGLYYDAYAMRAEVFFSNQEDSGCWFFSETNWFQVGVGGFAYKMCGFETKQDSEFVQKWQAHFGFDNLVTIDPVGRSGGLALFYNNKYQVKVLYSSNRMIDVEAEVLGKTVYLTFVYGDPVQKMREQVWEQLT
uniref:Zinc knuckle CX2CX4HX4C domain-containing protein n=1 Tax=Brassica oleracea var. oleracea TaxID=109376 RepID=A0A0D2ZRR0_BRAOL